MTDDRMALIDLIEKGAEGDLVRHRLADAAERMMELEVGARTGAPAGQSIVLDIGSRTMLQVPVSHHLFSKAGDHLWG